ncbi:SUMF1/EgtB/PvdO family nonheme iron enzyme [Candidatus Leptofilum sp.]|uniref:SUMF1/EgtB/PvdO family nonheme iron enzyme n=1 Tax=Candidatus Leptofilum sp. TaxID=3241576 RepID=UPI003B5C5DE2
MAIESSKEKRALDRILVALSPKNVAKGSAQVLLYGTAAATIYAVAGGNMAAVAAASPLIGQLVEKIGGDALAGLIDRVAQDEEEKLTAADIQQMVEAVFAQVQPIDYLTEQEFYRATRILEERDADRHRELLTKIEQIGTMLTPPYEAALKIYLETVVRQTSRLPLGPLDPSGRESSQLSLHQVFISLNTRASTNIFLPKSRKEERWECHAMIGHIYHAPKLSLLGDPGSGKSTLLRYVAFLLAQVRLAPEGEWQDGLSWTESGKYRTLGDPITGNYETKTRTRQMFWRPPLPIPILLNLRDLATVEFDPHSSTAIWKFVTKKLEKEDLGQTIPALRAEGQRGGLIFLLDGVDEVPVQQRSQVWQAIQSHDNGVYGGNRWVTTCRILSFNTKEAARVPVQTIEPFDAKQIDDFIGRWYGSLHTLGELTQEKAQTMTRQLQAAARREGLYPLAQNPMLLTIMTLVQTYYGTLPDERAKLYQQCVETLLLRWQRHKEAEQIEELPSVLAQLGTTQENLERLLWEIGWQAHNQQAARDEAADIPESEVVQIARKYLDGSYAKAEQFVEYTERRAHLLIGRGGQDERMFTFPHRTFQEYLAACHLASLRRFGRQAAKLAAESDSWREVLNLAAGTLIFNQKNREKAVDGIDIVCPNMLPDGNDAISWQQVWLAGEMAAVVGKNALQMDDVGQELLPRLQEMLAALLDGGRLTVQQRAAAGSALAVLGDPRPGVCSKELLMLPVITEPESFTLREKDETVTLAPFAIAKYPITNAQYRLFMADGGYSGEWRNCWSDEGWGWKEREGWAEPRYWHNGELNQANQPVAGVSWYEAEAFCNWLNQVINDGYRLPTEAEWELAAGHTDDRNCPWGAEWQMDLANTYEARLRQTCAVGMFPAGKAVCGATDMAGNVWEWMNSWYDEKKVRRVLRGGSWRNLQDDAQVGIRDRINPHSRSRSLGFRVVSPIGSGY